MWLASSGAGSAEMSMKYHPDRGGNVQVMQAINHAHDRLRQLAGVA
jgi:hypothetical protein